jgi:hypothetical protein
MDIEASEHDTAAIEAALITSFKPGDVVGKILAFIAQLRLSSEDTREYLKKMCLSRGCTPLEVKIWVRGRWGSLSDCFHIILSQRKARLSPSCLFRKSDQNDRQSMTSVSWLTTILIYRLSRAIYGGLITG